MPPKEKGMSWEAKAGFLSIAVGLLIVWGDSRYTSGQINNQLADLPQMKRDISTTKEDVAEIKGILSPRHVATIQTNSNFGN